MFNVYMHKKFAGVKGYNQIRASRKVIKNYAVLDVSLDFSRFAFIFAFIIH